MELRSLAMPSPFPGMNPYLEHPDVWHDFHHRFITAAAESLTAQVRPAYIVKVDAHIYLHELPDEPRRLIGRGDANIMHVHREPGPVAGTTATIEAPVRGRIELTVDKEEVNYLEIVDSKSRTVVTVVELLSPANKLPGSDREQYLAKRRQLFRTDMHLVEIDLLRAGPRMPVENLSPCDYVILVSHSEQRPEVDLWPLTLRQPLPTIPVPLKGEQTAQLDLQNILHRVYDSAGYADYVYLNDIEPPLAPADRDWIKQRSAAK
jgi:hypothetical protein